MKMNSEQLAWKIRRHGIEMTHLSGGSHIASVLSVADIVAVLYADIARVFPDNPSSDERDRIILSKGHAGAAIYAALAEKGFFDIEELKLIIKTAQDFPVMFPIKVYRALIFQQARSATGCLLAQVLQWRLKKMKRVIKHLLFWVTANAMKALYGKLR